MTANHRRLYIIALIHFISRYYLYVLCISIVAYIVIKQVATFPENRLY